MTALKISCLAFSLAFSLSISGQDNQMSQRGKLISEEYVGTIKASDINDHFPESKELKGDISKIPNYDIDLYRIVYTSVLKGKEISLSGLIEYPKTNRALNHLQYHHGTMLTYPSSNGEGCLDVPSLYDGKFVKEYKAQYETRLFGNYLASYGYLVSMPDYAGYNVSSQYEHPYSVNTALAEQSVDMILATKEFCKKRGIKLTGKLFLSGWSEGGAASLATQKLIESKYKGKLSVTANAPLAGFYNTTFYAKQFLNQLPMLDKDLGENICVLTWAIYATNAYSNNPIPNDIIFKYPVKDQLDVLKNRPSNVPSKLFKKLDKQTFDQLIKKVEINELAKSWSPVAPIYLNHGTDDDIVYYNNNVDVALKCLRKNGGKVMLRKYVKHDHYTLAKLYLLRMVDDFRKYIPDNK
jgi:hypothetical protein